MIEKITLKKFTNKIALDMGRKIIELSESRNQEIAVEVRRLNHTVFLYIGETLPADKHNWLRRKANVAILFEESSLNVKMDLEKGSMSLDKTFALRNSDYIAKGGSIPIFVENAGMVGAITVSGLKDVEDHQIIVDALMDSYI
ncbi:hypothetical protein A5881_001285 [Enterococcus termitis]|nr:hypothetical protein A5881_002979 [Enterococcus termitis]